MSDREITCQHHQPGSATWPDQLWARALFPPCSGQNSPVVWRPITVQRRYHSGVHHQLCSTEHKEAVHHNNHQTAAIIHGNWEVEVAHKRFFFGGMKMLKETLLKRPRDMTRTQMSTGPQKKQRPSSLREQIGQVRGPTLSTSPCVFQRRHQ